MIHLITRLRFALCLIAEFWGLDQNACVCLKLADREKGSLCCTILVQKIYILLYWNNLNCIIIREKLYKINVLETKIYFGCETNLLQNVHW